MKTALTAAVFLLATVLAGPAVADVPRNVHDGRSGVVTAEWGRVLCASNGTGLRCAIRVPGEFSRFDVEAWRGSKFVNMKAWAFPRVDRTYAKPRRLGAEVVPGARVRCESRGNQLSCNLRLDDRFDRVKVNVYSAGVSQGTMDGWF